jgi:F-type H+-transporting ATPase subunit delta
VTGSIGRRYARALLSLAKTEGRLEDAGTELRLLASVFAEPRLAAVIVNPTLGVSGRRELTEGVLAAAKTTPTVANLVRLLVARERVTQLPDISRAYDVLVDRELGRVKVGIRAAAPLAEPAQKEIAALARRLAGKDVVVTSQIDPELLGGVVLDVGGTVYDGSVRTRLARMSRTMAEGSR